VDFVNRWSSKTGIAVLSFLLWIGLATSKWHNWKSRYGKANEHNAWVPRDHWLEESEKVAILNFHEQHPLEGYRRLTFLMLDADVVAASPSSVYRVLKAAGVLERHNVKPSLKGKGFVQPLRPHQHWQVDVSSLNSAGTFYYLCSVLDGCSRYTVAGGQAIVGVDTRIETTVYCDMLCLHHVGTEPLRGLRSSQVVLAQTGSVAGDDGTVKRFRGIPRVSLPCR
jgi:hypothetical protein